MKLASFFSLELMTGEINQKMPLTLGLTLAELLTKILGHHTRAGAVAGVVGVVTWLIVVHLIG